jgi:SAM-dependent methyltransferase
VVLPNADAAKNRAHWDAQSDEYQRAHAAQLNTFEGRWGVWAIPEAELQVLGDVRGKDVLELGCGGAQWSITLARQGARPVGLDNSARQLQHAQRLLREAGVQLPLVQAPAEELPFAAASFDIVFCDHGGMSFADPRRTVPEAARVLRPGGVLAFNMASLLLFLCWDEEQGVLGERLRLGYFGLQHYDDGAHVEYQLPHGDWIRLFRRCGLEVEDLIELRPPPGAATTYPDYAPLDWARRWPAEQIWKARKRA